MCLKAIGNLLGLFQCARVNERGMNVELRNECKNYRGTSLLSVVGKRYAGIQVDRVREVTEGLIDDMQGEFRTRR